MTTRHDFGKAIQLHNALQAYLQLVIIPLGCLTSRPLVFILVRFTDTCRRLRSTMSAITASGSQGGESRPKKAI